MEPSAVRVLVVDDHQLIREGIASLLDAQPGIAVVGTAANGQEAVEQAQVLSPDVVVMDVRMPVMNGVDALVAIRQAMPACNVLMLSGFDDELDVVRAFRAGASGYLLKGIAGIALTRAIHLAHAGIILMDGTLAAKVNATGPDHAENDWPTGSPTKVLTSRELEVLSLIAAGASNREIAARLNLSEGTIKNHVSNILGRLGLRDRTQAAVYARDHRLL